MLKPEINILGQVDLRKYSDDEARDESGKWTSGGGSGEKELTDADNGRYGRGSKDTPKSRGGTANGRATRIGDKTRFGQEGPMTHEVVRSTSGSKEHFDLKPIVGGVESHQDMRANYLHTMYRNE